MSTFCMKFLVLFYKYSCKYFEIASQSLPPSDVKYENTLSAGHCCLFSCATIASVSLKLAIQNLCNTNQSNIHHLDFNLPKLHPIWLRVERNI